MRIIKLIISQFFSDSLVFPLLYPKTVPSTLFHNTVSIRFSLNLTDIISNPHKAQATLLSRISRFLCFKAENRKTKYFGLNISKHSRTVVSVIIYSYFQFLFVSLSQTQEICDIFTGPTKYSYVVILSCFHSFIIIIVYVVNK